MPTPEIIKMEDIEEIVNRVCDDTTGRTTLEVIEYQLENYCKHRMGFLADHQKLEILVKKRRGDECETSRLNFFIKSMPTDSSAQTVFIKSENQIFDHEAAYFNEILPLLIDATSAGDLEPWGPNCYLATGDFIVLEDLKIEGFAVLDRKCFRPAELEAAARAMARLHAASMLAEKKLGRSLKELYPKACEEQFFTASMRARAHLFESLISEVAERNGRGRVHGLEAAFDAVYEYIAGDGDERRRVMCHGDAWSNNYLFEESAEVAVPGCRLVDYQMVRYAPAMLDLAQLTHLSARREARRVGETRAVEEYWAELSLSLARCEPTAEIPSLDDLLREYEEARLPALFTAIVYYPTILLGNEVCAEHEDDPAAIFRKYVFRTDNRSVLELMERDSEYRERITEVVLEFVDIAAPTFLSDI